MPESITPFTLAAQLRDAQERNAKLAAQLARLQERAEIAEQAARDAWSFVRGVMHRPMSAAGGR